MYINLFICWSEFTSSFYIHSQEVGGAEDKQWEQLHKLAAVLGSDTGSSSLLLLSLVTLHKLSASWCNSLFAVLLWSCSATDDLPGTPLEWHPVSVIQFSGLAKPSAWTWSEREWTAVVCVLCPLLFSAWQGLPHGAKSKSGATPEKGFTPVSHHLPLFCSSHRNASTSSLRRNTWNV